MLKDFMLENVIPQSKDGDKKTPYIHDPMKAAVIMLSVCTHYGIKLSDGKRSQICTALCLPDMHKEDFLQYWADFSQEVPIFKK